MCSIRCADAARDNQPLVVDLAASIQESAGAQDDNARVIGSRWRNLSAWGGCAAQGTPRPGVKRDASTCGEAGPGTTRTTSTLARISQVRLHRLCAALLAFSLTACQSAKKVEQPLFTGPPRIGGLRVEAAAAAALSAPTPAFKQIKVSLRAPRDGHVIGTSIETLKAASKGLGQYTEDAAYSMSGGKCTLNNRSDAVGVGGFLVLQEMAQTWSPDCEGWGMGTARREVSAIDVLSGQLFPLKLGNKLTLRYTVVGTQRGRDEGVADYEEKWEESYEVVERIPEYRLESGRSMGEVFVIRTAAVSAGKKRTYTFLFSTLLGWRVGYSTDVRVIPVDWLK